MANRVQVILEAEDLTSGVIRGIVSQFGVLGNASADVTDAFSKSVSFMDLYKRAATDSSISTEDLTNSYNEASRAMARMGETLAVLVVQTLKDSFQFYQEYSAQVRDLTLVTGQGAEETSRFIQVLGDFELTAEDATTAARFLKEKGLSPNIDTLLQLSAQFKQIKDPAERLIFIQENLGRSGAKWVNILNQEEAVLRKAAEGVEEHLVISEEQLKLFEVQRLAIEDVKGAWENFKMAIGSSIGNLIAYNEAMTRANAIYEEQGNILSPLSHNTEEYKEILNGVMVEMLQVADASLKQTDVAYQNEEAIKAQEEALKNLSRANQEYLDLVGNITGRLEDYEQKHADIQAELDAGNITIDEAKAKWQELADEQELASRRMILSMLEQQLAVDGLSAKETAYLLDLGLKWGVYSEEAVAAAKAAQAEVFRLQGIFEGLPTEKKFTYIVNQVGSIQGVSISGDANQRIERRARGGSVLGGRMYEVTENNMPELLQEGGRQFLMMPPNASGNVVPVNSSRNVSGSSFDTERIVQAIERNAFSPEMFSKIIETAILRVVR